MHRAIPFPQATASALALLVLGSSPGHAADPQCEARSGAQRTPVVELYTSEGCSSCPPADRWLSTLKGQPVVAQAFHVAYWDYIGWKDRFAQPQFTDRQRAIAASNGLRNIYTPQLVRNGRDWRPGGAAPARVLDEKAPAQAHIVMRRLPGAAGFEATIQPVAASQAWTAHLSVTEDGHASRVLAGENAGETLRHDFVVRQFTPLGRHQGAQTLRFAAVASAPEHLRRINLIVTDPVSGEPLQALSMTCS
jgi:hypothetical protein